MDLTAVWASLGADSNPASGSKAPILSKLVPGLAETPVGLASVLIVSTAACDGLRIPAAKPDNAPPAKAV